jgi:NADH:ubiquinone oxidoreductase subunit C
MTNDEIKEYMSAHVPSAAFDESGEWLNILIDAGAWRSMAKLLRTEPLNLDYLFCLTCVDWKTHFTMVYHLTSTTHSHTVVVKSKLDRTDAAISTVSDIWRTAELHEREVYDLFGVEFSGHPDLRRLILTDDWQGFPLRKDNEDAVNMIKL